MNIVNFAEFNAENLPCMLAIIIIMVINNVSDWFQFVPLQLLSDTIEHTFHSVGGIQCTVSRLSNRRHS